ncbi:Actin-related protein 6 [Oopsacas minuta]|uniref:Actin-related protein 6 n=1 Tax=Oopsacas minuta TaxID=111878 RepID=A0AAV7K7W1_9METZ|nr:Actin-related protein 6 [Oopsacas minuta]
MSLIIDCGAHTIKAGLSSHTSPLIIPNYIARTKLDRNKSYVGSEVLSRTDMGGLLMLLAFQKGYLVNWDVERQVLDHLLGPSHLGINPQETDLVLSEPPFNFSSIRDTLDEILFEEYGFRNVTRATSANLSAFHFHTEHPESPSCMVIDSGFSFTHILPFCGLIPVTNGFIRIDVGGKFLTNQLKDLISYRQINVSDETYVINQVKEDTCFVSGDLYKEMKVCRDEMTAFRDTNRFPNSGIFIRYILPDFAGTNRGYIHDPLSKEACPPDRTLSLGNERFSVPELLFNPSDIGLDQMGLSESVQLSLKRTPPLMCESLTKNIILTGGNTLFPGFKDRLNAELRASLLSIHDLNVTLPIGPISYSWEGGKRLANTELSSRPIPLTPLTFQSYMEMGHNAWNAKSFPLFS